MMSERKKYNYNVGSSLHGYSRHSNTPMTPRNQNINNSLAPEPASYTKKIGELEIANKKLVDETARQFQKFEADIMRVQNILQQKEKRVQELEKDSAQAKEDQGTLIEALKQKQSIIQQLQVKLREIIETAQPSEPTTNTDDTPISEQLELKQLTSVEVQTEKIEREGNSEKEQKLQASIRRNIQLQEEVCKLKEQLFSVNGELALVQQEFSTYKVLHEIELVKNLNLQE